MFGIYLEDEDPFVSRLFAYFTNLFVVLIVASYSAMSVAYIAYSATQIEDVMYAALQCVNGMAILCIYLTLLLGKRDVVKLIKGIQTLVHQREC